jgi:hypothetical protein
MTGVSSCRTMKSYSKVSSLNFGWTMAESSTRLGIRPSRFQRHADERRRSGFIADNEQMLVWGRQRSKIPRTDGYPFRTASWSQRRNAISKWRGKEHPPFMQRMTTFLKEDTDNANKKQVDQGEWFVKSMQSCSIPFSPCFESAVVKTKIKSRWLDYPSTLLNVSLLKTGNSNSPTVSPDSSLVP